ncbi:hypothetical protein FSP39_005529 [Pinctada imbricata]|uniref:Tudor domain-containing protein n=1 Tax=Pinctada imbricata TaxID=66713 RepID=A0AA88XY62_PINIB|nr:hypothetical protein FSP39_005529 [Pinctada imbricata]
MEVEVFLGRVLHVIDPDNFWMHIGTNDHFAEFLQFEVNLEDFCRLSGNYIDDINEIYAGQFVLVDCTDNGGTWKRGQVSRVDSIQKCADVVYIDYGSTELVEESRLCANVPDEYLQFPFQALCCKLAGIQPIARSWTSRAVKMFQDMTVNQVFHTILLPSGPGWFKVVLYRQDGDERSIAHEMLAQELALVS